MLSRLLPVFSCLLVTPLFAADDVIFADFESENYQGWESTGTAFGEGPAKGALAGQMEISGQSGERLANSYAVVTTPLAR